MTASQPAIARRIREREIVLATRALFDERGMQDAPIEAVAKSVGIARGLIYRHFSSKEELYVLTVTDYLDELAGELEAATGGDPDPSAQLERCAEAYAGFCLRYPAFLDSSLALMRRPARELREIVSESVWLRLGQGMARCIDQLTQALRRGSESGAFAIADPDYTANFLWTQVLGAMHLARIGVGVRQTAPGLPALFPVAPEEVVRTSVASAMAFVSGRPRHG
ncbi:MAG TPA: TetR/AcrR family transcriptional regulator [Thermoleophilaceae bacterium]|nr:TetR/AcrR family transcriptional regulator [Thermoleophilaceae bacterium]